jgi:hypothetical protein
MPHEVFICYASQDELVAEAVCAALESCHIKCWIAPRDVLPGAEWAETIVDALDESRVLVLVLSYSSNTSPHVVREVGRAVDNSIPIIPLRIENVTPSKAMTFFISRHQWLDALTPPLEKHLKRLTDTVQKILARELAPQEAIEIAEAKEKAKREAAKAVRKVSLCPKCGIELRPNAIFCHKCGTYVSQREKAKKAEEKAKREAEEKAKRKAEEARRAKEAEEKAKRETEEKAKREAEEKAKREAAKAVQQVPLCPKCGVELRPNAIFCHKCGTRVSQGEKAK